MDTSQTLALRTLNTLIIENSKNLWLENSLTLNHKYY